MEEDTSDVIDIDASETVDTDHLGVIDLEASENADPDASDIIDLEASGVVDIDNCSTQGFYFSLLQKGFLKDGRETSKNT